MALKIRSPQSNTNKGENTLSYKEVKSLYDPLLYAYMIIGIDIFEKKGRRLKACKYITRFLHYITTVIGLITGAFQLGFFCDDFDIDVVFSILYIYTGLLLKFILNKRREDVLQAINVLSKTRMDMKYKPLMHSVRKKFSIICVSLIFLGWILLGILISHAFIAGRFVKFSSEFHMWFASSKYKIAHISTIYGISLFIASYYCCFLPAFIYCNVYTLISWHLKNILTEVKNVILNSPFDFRSNHHLYIKVKHLVEFVDSKLKYASFFVLLHFAIFIYFLIFSNFLRYSYFDGYRIVTSILLVAILISVVKAIYEAGEIPVINSQILSTMTEMPLDDNFHSHRILFIQQIKQGLYLTVGMVQLTRGWSAAVIGTIMTYSVLIKAL